MDILIISLLLALIPCVNFALKYYFSYKKGELKLFKSHITAYYLDWIFVLFNFLWLSVVNVPIYTLFIFLGISILIFLIWNTLWINLHREEKKPVYMFDINSGKIKPAGYIEFLFFTVESVLVVGFIFSTIKSPLVYVESALLGLFFLSCIYGSTKIHGKVSKSDLIMIFLGILAILGKVLFTLLL